MATTLYVISISTFGVLAMMWGTFSHDELKLPMIIAAIASAVCFVAKNNIEGNYYLSCEEIAGHFFESSAINSLKEHQISEELVMRVFELGEVKKGGLTDSYIFKEEESLALIIFNVGKSGIVETVEVYE